MLKAAAVLGVYATSGGTTPITNVTLNCSTTAGGGASTTVYVKPLTALSGSNEILVSAYSALVSGAVNTGSANTLAGTGAANVTITPPAIQLLAATSTGTTATVLAYTISLSPTASIGCQNVTTAAPTFYFNHITETSTVPSTTVVSDQLFTVNTEANSASGSTAASALIASSTTLNFTCNIGHDGTTSYPSANQTVTITTNAVNGTPYAEDTTGPANFASWVTTPGYAPGTAPVSGTTQQITVHIGTANGCNGLSPSLTPYTTTLNLASVSLGAGVNVADKPITINLTVSGPTASALTAAPSTINLSCTLTAPGSPNVYVPSANQTLAITAASSTAFTTDTTAMAAVPGWLNINGGTNPSGTATTTATNFTIGVVAGPGCNQMAVSGTPYTFTILLSSTGTPQLDKQIIVNLTVSNSGASPLVVNPSPITVSCVQSGSLGSYVYTPNYQQTVSVTSAAPGGTVFSISTSAPSWLNIGTLSTTTAGTSAATFTLQAKGTCNGGVGTTLAIHLANSPNLDKTFAVTLQIVPAKILTAAPSPASFTYVKGSGTAGFVDVSITSSITSPYFSINSSTLPSWLRTDTSSGNAPQSVRFSSTNVADTLAPGTYTASVVFSVSGYGDLTENVSMLLTNKAAQMTVAGPTIVPLTWVIGQGLPTPTITVLSTDTPIAYTATTGGSLAPQIPVAEQNGLAYSFGTPINVSFSPQVFAGAQPGNVLTGTVTLTWGSPVSTIVVTFEITVVSPGATISSLSPSTVANGQATFTVALVGTGFVPSTDPTQATKVGIVTTPGSAMTFDPAISYAITNQSNIALQFTYPGASYAGTIPFNTPGSVVIGVCNPIGGVPCTIATASETLYFGTNPIVSAVTSSSTLLQNGSTPSLAPYDMISIFGANFCPNCTSSQLLTGAPDAVSSTYPKSLAFTPTAAEVTAGEVAGTLVVTFQQHSGQPAFTSVNAPLLFATNGQINLVVPSTAPVNHLVDIVVSYTPLGSSAQLSTIYPVNVVATDPGIFTVGADGQGNGAILDLNYNLISATNPAGIRAHGSVPGTSDIVSVYMTGLGIPDSVVSSTGTGGGSTGTYSDDCLSPTAFLSLFNGAQTGPTLTSLDGTLILYSDVYTGTQVPCLLTTGTDAVSVTVGGVPVTNILYAGWTPNTIAGLYQVTFQLPDNTAASFTTEANLNVTNATITAPTEVPITITSNTLNTQAGVSMYVAPRLLMTGPTTGSGQNLVHNALAVTVGTPMTSSYAAANAVTATGATGNVTYAVTSGLLPSGLSIVASGTNAGMIYGTPAANTGNPGNNVYQVTVTATDQSTVPVTGSITFTVTVGDALYITSAVQSATTYSVANANVTTVTATGGVATYYYTLPNAFTTATGISIGLTSGVVSTSASTLAGTYNLVVTVTDSTSGTPIQTVYTFPIVVNLDETVAAIAQTNHAGGVAVVNTMTVTGKGSGTLSYSLDTASALLVTNGLLTFDTTTGLVSTTANTPISVDTISVTAVSSSTPTDGAAAGTATQSFTLTVVQ